MSTNFHVSLLTPLEFGLEEINEIGLAERIRRVEIKLLRIDQTLEQHDDDLCRAQKKTSTPLKKNVHNATTMTSRSHIVVSTSATQTVAEDVSHVADKGPTTGASTMVDLKIQ